MATQAQLAELEAWRARAAAKLDWQAARAQKYQSYYDGEALPPVLMTTEERQVFQRFIRISRANWAELVVNAVAERLTVTGFDFGPSSDRAWAIWTANGMDAGSELAQTDALVTGQAPVLVQPSDDSPVGVEITPESPEEACILYEPGSRTRRACGYKRRTDPASGALTEVVMVPWALATWLPGEGGSRPQLPVVEDPPVPGQVPLVEIIPHPRTKGAPRSELKPVLPIQDRIQVVLFNRLVATDYSAFRQVWATGARMAREIITGTDGEPAPELDPSTGQPTGKPKTRLVPPYRVGVDRLLINENPQGAFGAIPEGSLRGYLDSVEMDVNTLAAVTQTPPHYLLGQIANLSADAITAAEAGLVAKVKRRARHIAQGWLGVQRLALGIVGDVAAADQLGTVAWADAETRSLAQLTDALMKMATLGVPRVVLWERWGASQDDIRRWQQLASAEAAETAASQAAALGAADIAALLAQAGAGGAAAGPAAGGPPVPPGGGGAAG